MERLFGIDPFEGSDADRQAGHMTRFSYLMDEDLFPADDQASCHCLRGVAVDD